MFSDPYQAMAVGGGATLAATLGGMGILNRWRNRRNQPVVPGVPSVPDTSNPPLLGGIGAGIFNQVIQAALPILLARLGPILDRFIHTALDQLMQSWSKSLQDKILQPAATPDLAKILEDLLNKVLVKNDNATPKV